MCGISLIMEVSLARGSLLSFYILKGQVTIMYKDMGNVCAIRPVGRAVMFMNTNKSEENIRKLIRENRVKCGRAGIMLDQAYVVSKGPDRDIDRDAVNMLISQLLTGRYDTVVVERMADLTADRSDLEEFIKDAAGIGVGFFVLSTMRYHMYGLPDAGMAKSLPIACKFEVTV